MSTVIDAQTAVEGTLNGRDAQVLGRFRGDVELSGRLTIGDGARVEARVKAESAEIAGEFKGELTVASLVILEKGRVEGIITAQKLAIREGATVTAAFNAGQPGAPAKAAPAPAPAAAPAKG